MIEMEIEDVLVRVSAVDPSQLAWFGRIVILKEKEGIEYCLSGPARQRPTCSSCRCGERQRRGRCRTTSWRT
jgi:hypothetical protein